MHVQGKKCKHALFLILLPCTLISMYLSSLVACDVPKSCALLQAHQDTLLAALNWQENIDNTNGIWQSQSIISASRSLLFCNVFMNMAL